jgi:hypothetical protein
MSRSLWFLGGSGCSLSLPTVSGTLLPRSRWFPCVTTSVMMLPPS